MSRKQQEIRCTQISQSQIGFGYVQVPLRKKITVKSKPQATPLLRSDDFYSKHTFIFTPSLFRLLLLLV